jgi:hypothetical protein
MHAMLQSHEVASLMKSFLNKRIRLKTDIKEGSTLGKATQNQSDLGIE